jgi:flagellar biosynthesis protein FlhG
MMDVPSQRVESAALTAIASGKGGVGKTWFAITLAQAWAGLGRSVLLFDGDLGLANIDIQLGLPPGPGLGAVLAGRMRLSEAAIAHPAFGFSVLAGQSGSGALSSLPLPQIAGLVSALRGLPFDDIIMDLGAGLDHANRHLAAQADRLLVLVTDEPTALTDAYAVIKVHAGDVPSGAPGGRDVRIAVNQAVSIVSGQRTYAKLARACSHFLHCTPPLAGIIRQDDKVRDAIRHQTPLLTRHPGSPAATDMARLARHVVDTPILQAARG